MADKTIKSLLILEQQRQEATLNLIASENYSSPAVRQALGSILTDKYAEGYPGKRYYAGCHIVDKIEQIACKELQELFGAEHANVQPHSGSQANMAVYFSCLKPGDTVVSMNLSAGGHLTHGHPLNFSGKLYQVVSYGVDLQTGLIDYDQVEQLVRQHKPKLLIVGASAYSREIDYKRLADMAHANGSLVVADIAHVAGLIVAELIQNPTKYVDFVTGTTHKTMRGPRGGFILCKAVHARNIDRSVMPGVQGGPMMHAIAAKVIAFEEASKPEFKTYQANVIENAQAMATVFVENSYKVISGGTDTHLFLVDVTSIDSEMSGKIAEQILETIGITVNRNMIPNDSRSPLDPSGIRIGTPAITARGMGVQSAKEIAQIVVAVLSNFQDVQQLAKLKIQVAALCQRFSIEG